MVQGDPAWGNVPYGGYRDANNVLRSVDSTLAYDGCFITCLAMMHQYFGVPASRARPDSINDFLQHVDGYRPSFGVFIDSAGPTAVVNGILHFMWGKSQAPVGRSFDIEAGADSAGPYPVATVRVVNADSVQGRARVVAVQRPTLPLVNKFGAARGDAWAYRATFDFSNQGWYAFGIRSSADSVEAALADSLPVALKVVGGSHWVVATGMTPAWVSSTQARGTYSVLDPLVGTSGRLIEAPYNNTYDLGIVGLRYASTFPAPDGATAGVTSSPVPELEIALTGPCNARITDPIGRTIAYDPVGDRYISEIPNAIALRSVRHGNVSDPGGLFRPFDSFEIPNAMSGTYVVDAAGPSGSVNSIFAESSVPGIRVTDAMRQFSVPNGGVAQCAVNYDGSGGAPVSMSAVTGVEQGQNPLRDDLLVSPNPVMERARVTFELPRAGDVRLEVFDIQGRVVAQLASQFMQPGQHSVEWVPATTQAGVYFVKLMAPGVQRVARAVRMER